MFTITGLSQPLSDACCSEKKNMGLEIMACGLSVHTALAEDQSSVPRPHIRQQTTDQYPLLVSVVIYADVYIFRHRCRHRDRQTHSHTHIHTLKMKGVFKMFHKRRHVLRYPPESTILTSAFLPNSKLIESVLSQGNRHTDTWIYIHVYPPTHTHIIIIHSPF